MHSDKLFSTKIDVRFSDLDALGHVNNAVFFTYFEEGRKYFSKKVFNVADISDFKFIDYAILQSAFRNLQSAIDLCCFATLTRIFDAFCSSCNHVRVITRQTAVQAAVAFSPGGILRQHLIHLNK